MEFLGESLVREQQDLQSSNVQEGQRISAICNSCRYCENVCAVFPAIELRRLLDPSDMEYLSNLCHECGACFSYCQYAPPHEFAVDLPSTFAAIRSESYENHCRPRFLKALIKNNAVAVTTAFALSGILLVVLSRPGTLGSGNFYSIIPHGLMVEVLGLAFLLGSGALYWSVRHYFRSIAADSIHFVDIWQAARDASTLRYLTGAGAGCSAQPSVERDKRRLSHHFVFYGFLLCFLSTLTATGYHYVLHMPAPYPLLSLPVTLGVSGGLVMIYGAVPLVQRRLKQSLPQDQSGLSTPFLVLIVVVPSSGLLLLLLRCTSLLRGALIIHLAAVLAFFLLFPISKFVHGFYRLASLLRYVREMGDGKETD